MEECRQVKKVYQSEMNDRGTLARSRKRWKGIIKENQRQLKKNMIEAENLALQSADKASSSVAVG